MNTIITTEYFERNTIIDTDFDVAKVYNHIIDAQEVQVKHLIGRELYFNVLLWLEHNYTPTPIQSGLLNVLKPFTLKCTEMNLIPFLNTPVTAKGTMNRSGDYTQPANDVNSGLILDNVRAKCDHYAEDVIYYLNKNSKDFPEWANCDANGEGDFYSAIFGI